MPVVMTVHVESDVVSGALFDIDLEDLAILRIRPETHASYRPVVNGNLDSYFARIVQFLNEYIAIAGIESDLAAIALIHPGVVDSDRGIVVEGGRFLLNDIPLGETIRNTIGVPTFVFNDGPCLALGEVRGRWSQNETQTTVSDSSLDSPASQVGMVAKNFVYVIVGEGVGSCIFIEGKHYLGGNLSAGDLGHIMIADEGRMCPSCHRPGCLETYTSRYWIAYDIIARYNRANGKYEEDTAFNRSLAHYKDPNDITVESISRAVQETNEFVIPVLTQAADRLGFGIALVVDYLNPDLFIFGGELMDKVPLYYELTLKAAGARCYPLSWQKTERRRAVMGRRAEHWGAVDLVIERLGARLTSIKPEVAS